MLWPSHRSRDPDPDMHGIGGQATGCGRGHTSSVGDQRIASSSFGTPADTRDRRDGSETCEAARRHARRLGDMRGGSETYAQLVRANVTAWEAFPVRAVLEAEANPHVDPREPASSRVKVYREEETPRLGGLLKS